MKKISFLKTLQIIALLLVSQLIVAQPPQVDLATFDAPMTLEECMQYAIQNNPNLQMVRLDELANQAQIKEIKSAALPQVSGSGQYQNNFALAEQLLPGEIFGQPGTTIPVRFGVQHTMNAGLNVQQTLFNKSIKTGLKAAEASQAVTQLNTFKTMEDLIYQMAQIYLQLQLTEKQKELLNANLSRVNNLIDIAQIQFEEGIIKKIDVDQLKVNRTNLKSELQNLNIGVAQQKNYLKFYMGMPQNKDIQLAEYVMEDAQYILTDRLILDQNTNLKLLAKQFELTNYELENIKAGYYPTVSAFMNYGWNGQTDKLFSSGEGAGMNGNTTGIWGLNLNVPIFDGFKKRRQQEQVLIKQNQLRLQRKTLVNQTELEFANANQTLTMNRVLLETQKENMTLAEELYNVTKLSYREGVAPLTELLNAETSLKESQSQYITALLQIKLGELDHLKTSGQLAKLIQEAEVK